MRCDSAPLGREAELERVSGRPGSLVLVEGHPGIGKTTLLDAARCRVCQQGTRALSAAGQEIEAEFAFGVVRQLLEPAVAGAGPRERSDVLAGPAALAAAVVGAPEAGVGTPPDSLFPVLHALYWLTCNLAQKGPLTLFVDDVQWVDLPSLRFLDYLAGRLRGSRVGLVMASRPPEGYSGERADMLARLRERARSALVQLGPLPPDAAATLLAERFGRQPHPALVAASIEATGGNPFLLGALVDALIADQAAPDAAAVALVRGLGPETVARSVLLRVARLASAAVPVVDAIAVLDAHAECRHVAAMTGLPADDVAAAADALVAANVLDGSRPWRFVHPMVRQAVYRELGAGARARLHAEAARVLMADRQPPGIAAAHLLLAEPAADPAVVAVLSRAAAEAQAQGASELARRLWQRALDEPPTSELLPGVLAGLGLAEALVGDDLAAAADHLTRAAAGEPDSTLRAERVRMASRVLLYSGHLAAAVQGPAAERSRLAAGDREAVLLLLAEEAGVAVLDPAVGGSSLAELEEYADLPGKSRGELAVLAELAAKRWLQGDIAQAVGLARRALAGGRLLADEGPLSVAFNHALAVLIDGDQFEAAAGPLDAGLASARRRGSVLGLASLTGCQVVAAWRRGAMAEVGALADTVLGLARASGTTMIDHSHRAYLAAAHVERDELDQAEAAIEPCQVGPGLPNTTYGGMPWLARARLRLARGRPDLALDDLLEMGRRERALGVRHLRFGWRRDAVVAAVAAGERDLARQLAAEQAELSARWDTPWARGLALSTQGLAAEGPTALDALALAATVLGTSPARLDHARALADLGAVLRRAGRPAESREHLRAAVDQAHRCGAIALARRAGDELAAAGGRPRRPRSSGVESLTNSERRVAALAAAGAPNRAIAAELFVTVRTVENHLAHTYRKLGIRSRTELASALTDDGA